MEFMINWWAVIVAAIASMVIGSIWYGPLFGKQWMKVMGHDPASMTEEKKKAMRKSAGPLYAIQFVLSLITAYILVHYTYAWQAMSSMSPVSVGVINALWIWLGFVMPVLAGNAMWSGKPKNIAWSMFWINAGYNLVLFAVFGLILGAWR